MADRITILSQHFYPETAATAQLLTDLAAELSIRGYEVAAVTAQPAYHERRRLPRRETVHGVEIKRCLSFSVARRHLAGRLLSGVSFALSAWLWLLFSRDGSLILVVTTPPYLAWGASLAKALRRKKYVVLIHDVYPEVAVELGYMKKNGVVEKVWQLLDRWTYRSASATVVLGDCVKQIIQKKVHAPAAAERVEVIHNWVDETVIRPLPKHENWFAKRHALLETLVVLYSGNMGLFHDLDGFVEAADRLRDTPGILFLFVGEGAKKAALRNTAESLKLPNVRFLTHQPAGNLAYSLSAGDVGLVSLKKGVEDYCVPSKVYGYLAAGLPLLAVTSRDSEVDRIINEFDCGIRVDQGDIDAIVRALRRWRDNPALLDMLKKNARRCSEVAFGRRQAMEHYAEVFRRALASHAQ